jgi:putative glutamine amidotransferase
MDPIIGITADHHEKRHRVGIAYANAIVIAGGVPLILPPILSQTGHYLSICDGFVFTGGDDPLMEDWNIPTHASATPVAKERQEFELALLALLQDEPNVPVLGVCLGMQWMGLLAGGTLEQDLPEPHASHHRMGEHAIDGEIGSGKVYTHHHQALSHSGSLSVIATSDDGVIEAVRDYSKNWYVGVQWHPERTGNSELGQDLFNQLVAAVSTNKAMNA